MTDHTVYAMKDVPHFSKVYFIGKNENGEVSAGLAKYEAKYGKPSVSIRVKA